ncbi:MAG: hypothetical protein QOG05_4685, partial [Streptosporangiaceae bacterium]|nr:hypothetical protein [Streptosporangiaceae bacterium]
QLGLSLADVVSTRILVTDISRWQEYGRAHKFPLAPLAPAGDCRRRP